MIDYYKNLTNQDINEVLNLNEMFEVWDTYYHSTAYDLYFVGIKKGANKIPVLPKLYETSIICTTNDI
jgi:hypothetical protein